MRRKLGAIAIALYVISLLVPAIVVIDRPLFGGGESERTVFGIQCLIYGFFLWPGWIANPLLAIAVAIRTATSRPGWMALATGLCVVAVLSALVAPMLLSGFDLVQLVHVHVGYLLWFAACIAAALEMHLATMDARERRAMG